MVTDHLKEFQGQPMNWTFGVVVLRSNPSALVRSPCHETEGYLSEYLEDKLLERKLGSVFVEGKRRMSSW
jgi:hypothetical protein